MQRSSFSINSIRKVYLFLIPVSAAVGNYLLVANFGFLGISLWRLLVFGSCLFVGGLDWLENKNGRLFLFIVFAWLGWGLLSLLWTPDVNNGTSDVANLFFYLLLIYGLLNLRAYEPDNLKALCFGWVGAYLLSGIVAIWELLTNNHLPGYWIQENPLRELLKYVTISLFSNPNNYSAFILLSVPFLLLAIDTMKGYVARTALYMMLITVPLFILTSGTRIALIGFFIQILTSLFMKKNKFNTILIIAIMVSMSFVVLYGMSSQNEGKFEKILSLREKISSDESFVSRANLSLNGLSMLYHSYGMGFGAASYESITNSSSIPLRQTGGIVNPHNYSIQILSEYGILVFGFFMYWVIKLVNNSVSNLKCKLSLKMAPGRRFAETIIIGLIGYLFASVCHSSYMKEMTNWTFLATLNIIGAYLYNIQKVARRDQVAMLPNIRETW